MLQSYRYVIIAAFGSLIAAVPSQGSTSLKSEPHVERGQSNQRQVAAASIGNDAGQLNKPCENQPTDRRSQLCAQWNAADAGQAAALWAKNAFWANIVSIVVSSLALGAAFRAAWYTKGVYELEQKPFLSIAINDWNDVVWERATQTVGISDSLQAGDTKSPVFCTIKSAGRSTAILTGIGRAWVATDGRDPPVLNPEARDGVYKPTYIPIGPDGVVFSTNSESAQNAGSEPFIHFYGYLIFEDARGKSTYVSGYCFSYAPHVFKRGLVTGMPRNNGDKYWYHRQLRNKQKSRQKV